MRSRPLVQEAKCRTEAASVDELYYGEQLFQLVFQRCAGQHESVPALQLFDSARRARGPVPDALRLIEDDQVGRHLLHVAHVLEHQFVTGQVEEFGRRVQTLPSRQQPVDNL